MRDILFRGKAIDVRCNERWIGKGEWVYGFYHYTNWYDRLTKELVETNYWILPVDGQDACQVDPSTVGQYTGLTDKNGNRVYENDILFDEFGENYCIVKFGEYASPMGSDRFTANVGFYTAWFGKYQNLLRQDLGYWLKSMNDTTSVVGNIHDNPELLGG